MSRSVVRKLKKGLVRSSCVDASRSDIEEARSAALALLERSIKFGHGKLAIQRLALAVKVGAVVPPSHLAYCIKSMAAERAVNHRVLESSGTASKRSASRP